MAKLTISRDGECKFELCSAEERRLVEGQRQASRRHQEMLAARAAAEGLTVAEYLDPFRSL